MVRRAIQLWLTFIWSKTTSNSRTLELKFESFLSLPLVSSHTDLTAGKKHEEYDCSVWRRGFEESEESSMDGGKLSTPIWFFFVIAPPLADE